MHPCPLNPLVWLLHFLTHLAACMSIHVEVFSDVMVAQQLPHPRLKHAAEYLSIDSSRQHICLHFKGLQSNVYRRLGGKCTRWAGHIFLARSLPKHLEQPVYLWCAEIQSTVRKPPKTPKIPWHSVRFLAVPQGSA